MVLNSHTGNLWLETLLPPGNFFLPSIDKPMDLLSLDNQLKSIKSLKIFYENELIFVVYICVVADGFAPLYTRTSPDTVMTQVHVP